MALAGDNDVLRGVVAAGVTLDLTPEAALTELDMATREHLATVLRGFRRQVEGDTGGGTQSANSTRQPGSAAVSSPRASQTTG